MIEIAVGGVLYCFNQHKDAKLRAERHIGFIYIIERLNETGFKDMRRHHNQRKHPGQLTYEVDIRGYIYIVPFDMEGNKRILRTIYPSRKATRNRNKQRNDT